MKYTYYKDDSNIVWRTHYEHDGNFIAEYHNTKQNTKIDWHEENYLFNMFRERLSLKEISEEDAFTELL